MTFDHSGKIIYDSCNVVSVSKNEIGKPEATFKLGIATSTNRVVTN